MIIADITADTGYVIGPDGSVTRIPAFVLVARDRDEREQRAREYVRQVYGRQYSDQIAVLH